MLVTLSGIVMLVRLVQEENAEYPIVVALGILMMVSSQPQNAWFPMVVTLFGIVTLISLVQQ
jgi:hypothetical protein